MVEHSYDFRNKLNIESLLLYDISNNTYPGDIIASLNVTKRWPSWDVARSISPGAKAQYDIFFVTYNQYNHTVLCKTFVDVGGVRVYSY